MSARPIPLAESGHHAGASPTALPDAARDPRRIVAAASGARRARRDDAMRVSRVRMCVRSWFAVATFVFALVACASPTIPLPPPALPTVTASSTPGHVHLSSKSGAEPNAIIVIVNQNTSIPADQRVSGSEADGSGSWDADVLASKGDVLEITETSGTVTSPSTTVQVP